MTAVASSSTPIVDARLVDKILSLPEKKFWDLVDLRLNRPKGFRRSTNTFGEDYVEIIDANGKPSIVERWTEECIIDELFLQLATTKNIVLHNGKCGITVWKYYDQAFKLYRHIPLSPPEGLEQEGQYRIPKFVIDLSDLSSRLYAELRCVNDPQYVAKQAVGRLFENIVGARAYHLNITPKLRVELSVK
jgi:hypothetical protein